jgi:predicted MPP superfamily phosphohydrolase
MSRRRFFAATILAAPLLVAGEARWLEPTWVKTRRVRLGPGAPRHRFVQITDIHHKGDRAYLQSVVRQINALSPEFVCFTGDLIEKTAYLAEALEILTGIKSPLYGVPGNHDYWSHAPFEPIARCFEGSGGAWLLDEQRITADGKFCLSGGTCLSASRPPLPARAGLQNIFLMHYPAWINNLQGQKYDLILAGHSHGGQVRLPFYGALFVTYNVGKYVMGRFETGAGTLYVNPGIGWFPVPIRFNCRPEITVFEV